VLVLILSRDSAAQVEIPEAEAAAKLATFAETYDDRPSWEGRARHLRERILAGAGLARMPVRTPLNAVLHSRRELEGYSVENVYFESFPGYFVTGNLYRPLDMEEKPAGVLCPHGHWETGRFREDMQARCATLARMGAIVFAYDMAGWQESNQIDHRNDRRALTYQLWNSMRALDFLVEQNADAERLGVTGASGGGTQTFLLAALDERVAAAAPVVMVSAHFCGGCNCESGRPIHRSKDHETNNAEICALIAPRPLLLVSCGGDWTKNVPRVEFPYVRAVYELYGAGGRVENAHFADEGHDYGASKRRPVYTFFAKHLGLGEAPLEDDLSFLEHDALRVFDEEHPLPTHALEGTAVQEGFKALRRRR